MICPNCEQQTEPGKFCTNCGAQLSGEEAAAASDPMNNVGQGASPPIESSHEEAKGGEGNDTVDKLKKEVSDFGGFFLKLLKEPSAAQKTNSTSLIPGIITMVIFSLFIALGTYLVARQISSIFMEISFVDSFLLPLGQFLVLFGVLAALTFAGAKLAAQTLSFTGALAKFGAYSVPFLVLAVLGFLLSLISIPFSGTIIVLSLIGPILLIPVFIIMEQPANGFDRIFIILGVCLVSLVVASFLIQNVLGMFMGGMMDSILGGF